MKWYLLGCDPDSRGALAVIHGSSVGLVETIRVLDCPVEKHATRRVVSVEKMVEQVRALVSDLGIPKDTVVHFEDGGTRPGLSPNAALVFGRCMGAWHAALESCGLKVRLVQPATWKTALKLTAEKSESVSMARVLFRNAEGAGDQVLKLSAHGRAEALLIAAHGHWVAQRDAQLSDILTGAVDDAIAARPEASTRRKRKRRDEPNVPDASDGAGPAEVPAADNAKELEADRDFARVQWTENPADVAQLLKQQGATDVIFVAERTNAD